MRTGLVVSTDAGLTRDGARDVGIAPLHVIVAGCSHAEDAPTPLDADNVEAGTSCPSPGDYARAIDSTAGDAVLVLTPDARFSGGFHAARIAATTDALAAGARGVEVIDTGVVGCAYALVCRVALRALRDGVARSTLRDRIASTRSAVHMYGLLATLAPLRRSGRLTRLAAAMVERTGVVFLFEFHDNRYRLIGAGGREGAALDRVITRATRAAAGPQWVVAFAGGDQGRAAGALALLQERMEIAESWVYRAGPATVVHAGRSVLGFAIAPADICTLATADATELSMHT